MLSASVAPAAFTGGLSLLHLRATPLRFAMTPGMVRVRAGDATQAAIRRPSPLTDFGVFSSVLVGPFRSQVLPPASFRYGTVEVARSRGSGPSRLQNLPMLLVWPSSHARAQCAGPRSC